MTWAGSTVGLVRLRNATVGRRATLPVNISCVIWTGLATMSEAAAGEETGGRQRDLDG